MTTNDKSRDHVEASSIVIPAEASGPERVADARERAYGPGRESRNPVTRSGSNSTEAGGYWVPARRKPGVAGLAWPG